MKGRLSTLSHTLRVTLITHVFMFGISTPLLMLWNLSHSYMTSIGNSIFSPFFIFFTFISTLLFFTELLHLPNRLLIGALENGHDLWLVMLNLGKKSWLFEYALPHVWTTYTIFILLVLGLLSLRPSPFEKRKLTSICCVIIILISFMHITYYYRLKTPTKSNLSAKLEIEQTADGFLNVVDHGFLKEKKNIFQYITFELKPYLLRTYGTTAIENLVLHSPGIDSFKATGALCNHCTINTICVPYFPQPLSRYGWFCFFNLKKQAQQQGIRFVRKSIA